eukprot:446293_1
MSHRAELVLGTKYKDLYTSNEIDDPKMKKLKDITHTYDQSKKNKNNYGKYDVNEMKHLILKRSPKEYVLDELKGVEFNDNMTTKTIKKKILKSRFNGKTEKDLKEEEEKLLRLIIWAVCQIQNETLRSEMVNKLHKEQDLENFRGYGFFCGKEEVKKQVKKEKSGNEEKSGNKDRVLSNVISISQLQQ